MKSLSTEELNRMWDGNEDFALINVVPESDFQQRHIPGSASIPLADEDFIERIRQLVGRIERKIVVYGSGRESREAPVAARMLKASGFLNIYSYDGGAQAWHDAGLPLRSAANAPPLSSVHLAKPVKA